MASSRNGLARWTINPAFTLVACIVLSGVADGAPQEDHLCWVLARKVWRSTPNGALVGWEGRSDEKATAKPSSAGEIRYAGNILKLAKPAAVAREASGFSFTYRWPEEPTIEVIVQHRLTRQSLGIDLDAGGASQKPGQIDIGFDGFH